VSELPTGSDEVRKEADPVFRAIGKRFRMFDQSASVSHHPTFAVHSTGGRYLVFRGGVQVRLK
jgi:hypothetical protein